MTSTSLPGEPQPPPPLLALPPELKLQILTYLSRDTSPNLACLRRTHPSFLNIIPKSDVRSKSSRFLLRSQLLDAELNHPDLLPPHHYPCYPCIKVLTAQDFHPYLTQYNLVLGGACAYNRFCYRCGQQQSATPEEKRWKETGWKQVALQPLPVVERVRFRPTPLPYDGTVLRRFVFDDYWREDFEAHCKFEYNDLPVASVVDKNPLLFSMDDD